MKRAEVGLPPGAQLARSAQSRTIVVKVWATVGTGFLSLYVFSTARWLLGGHAKPTITGAESSPTWLLVGARAHEVVFTLVAGIVVYRTVVRPLRRDGRLGTDGWIVIAGVTVWWMDPVGNYNTISYVYPSTFHNLGCPQCYLPFWQSNALTYAEPPLFTLMYYIGFTLVIMWIFTAAMRWYQRRRPQAGRATTVMFCYAVALVFALVSESIWLRFGGFIYAGAFHDATLFNNHYYQMPLYELPMTAALNTAYASVYYFRDDFGNMIAERGLQRLRGGRSYRNIVRYLAVVGLLNAILLVCWVIPLGLSAGMNTDSWSTDVVQRPYFTQDICGPGTKYACQDPRVPAPRGTDSLYVTPDGQIVTPEAGLPHQTR
jgi:Spirocyclase AveC-like